MLQKCQKKYSVCICITGLVYTPLQISNLHHYFFKDLEIDHLMQAVNTLMLSVLTIQGDSFFPLNTHEKVFLCDLMFLTVNASSNILKEALLFFFSFLERNQAYVETKIVPK